jgi:hypothetical protein
MSKVTTLTAVLLVSAVACSKKKDDPRPASAPEVQPPAPTPAPAPPPTPPGPSPMSPGAMTEIKDVGLATPESVLYLADQDLFLVSNIDGQPTGTDDNGFISKVDADGKVTELKWIDGGKPDVTLNAPKGMAVRGGLLYVADITAVRMFDLATGAPKGQVEIAGAGFLNDVVAAGDQVYVSDSGLTGELKPSGTDAVYAIDAADKVTKVASGADLEGTNGLAVVGGAVWVVTFRGKQLYRLADGKKADTSELPTGGLDGLEALDDGRVVVSSWEGKALYIGKPGGAFSALAENVESPADLGIDRKRNRVVVPIFMGNALRFYPIP